VSPESEPPGERVRGTLPSRIAADGDARGLAIVTAAPSPAIAGRDLSTILDVEMQRIGARSTSHEKTTINLFYSICDRACGEITRSEGDPAAGHTHRDNLLASTRQWVLILAHTRCSDNSCMEAL